MVSEIQIAAGAVQLDPEHALNGLSPKQYQFVKLAFSGMSYTDAYRQVYDCSDASPATISKRASDEANHPLVQAKMRALRVQADAQATLAPSLTKNFVINGLMNLALNGDKDSVKLGALTQLGKTVGIDLFRETTRVERIERTPEQVEAELREHLARMTATIDGTSRPVASQPNPDPEPPRRQRRPRG